MNAPPAIYRSDLHTRSTRLPVGAETLSGGTPPPDAAEADRRVPGRSVPRPFDNWRVQSDTTLLLAPPHSEENL